jgi:hypothetical protein
MGEPSPGYVEQLGVPGRLCRVHDEEKLRLGIYEATDQPDAGRPVYVATAACRPAH